MQGALLDKLTTGSHTLSYIKERNVLVGAGITCNNNKLQLYNDVIQDILEICMVVTCQLKLIHPGLATMEKMATAKTLQTSGDDNQYLMMMVCLLLYC